MLRKANVGQAFLHNFFFFLGFYYYLDKGDAWIGFGIISFGVLVSYFYDDIVNFLWNLFGIRR